MDVAEQAAALLGRVRAGEADAAGELFELYRERLLRMLSVRLDPRVAGRVSADDVLQDTFLDVARRIGEYVADPAVPFYVWLRFLAVQRMQMVRRAHLGAGVRAVGREAVSPPGGWYADADSMAGQLVGRLTSPSQAAIRLELQDRLRAALDEMDPVDREVLALRHFEELGNGEAAAVLNITKDAASKRYVRALRRLGKILADPDEPTSI